MIPKVSKKKGQMAEEGICADGDLLDDADRVMASLFKTASLGPVLRLICGACLDLGQLPPCFMYVAPGGSPDALRVTGQARAA